MGINTADPASAAHSWLDSVTFPVVDDPTPHPLMWSYVDATSITYPVIYIIGWDMVITAFTEGVQPEDTLRGLIMDAVYRRDPLDIGMVMDVSGSMNSPSPSDPTGDAKLYMMKQSATIITDFLHDHGQATDHMGLVWFTDDASEHTDAGGDKLLSVRVDADWTDLRSQINAHGTGNCTAMGAGLQTAFNTLTSPESTQDRFIILCTDGMQNIEPKLTKVGSQFQLLDSGGWICGGHSSIPESTTDIVTYDTPIHPIGVGITATYATLLQEVADATGGFYRGTNDPDVDLDLIYTLDLCSCMAAGSPAVVHYNAGQLSAEVCEAEELFYINRSVRKMTVFLSWKKAQGSNLAFWLYTPQGHLLDLHHELKHFETHAMATIYVPRHVDGEELSHVGQWRMVIRGETPGGYADYHAIVIAEDQDVKYILDYPRKLYEVGDLLPVRVRLLELKEPLLAIDEIVMETAHLRVPLAELLARSKVSPYELERQMEQAGTQANPVELKLNAMAADPRFADPLTPVRQRHSLREGKLECRIEDRELLIPVMLDQPGLHSFKVEILCETSRSGPISRVDMVSVHVGPGKTDPGQTHVSLVEKLAKGVVTGAVLQVTPRNEKGQLLGPGFAHELAVAMEKEALEVEVEDQLDGTYQIEFSIPKKLRAKRAATSVTFRGKPVWKGKIGRSQSRS